MQKVLFEYAFGVDLYFFVFYNKVYMSIYIHPNRRQKRMAYAIPGEQVNQMLKSMTGFGRCEIADKDRKVIVEMKSVNHRYCDITIKMPKKLSFFESAIRSLLKKYIQRGKVDIFITYEDYTENRSCLKYNRELAAEYMDAIFDDFMEFHRE